MSIVPCSRSLLAPVKISVIAATAALLIGAAISASAASIGVSFVGRGADPADLLAPTDVAGVAPQTHWTNVRDDGNTFDGKATSLSDDSGNLTDVALIYDASDSWNSDGTTTSNDEKLMKGILKANPEPDTAPANNSDRILLTFTNLPTAGVYTVIVYSMENGDSALMDVTLGGPTYYIQQEAVFPGVYYPASVTGPGAYIDANYAGFTNVSPAANGAIAVTC